MENTELENAKPETVSYYVFEGEMARAERHSKRWAWAFLIAFIALVCSNIGWIVYESQFEDVITTVTQETSSDGGGDAIINGTYAGAVIDGEIQTDGDN